MDLWTNLKIYSVLIGVIIFEDTSATPFQNYSDLYLSLFTNYNVNLRPVRDDRDPVNVSVEFVLLSIDGLSETDQALTTNGWLLLQWNDEILTWDEEATGVPEFIVQQKAIWRPDVTIKNTVKQRNKMGFDEQPVSVSANGRVLWAPGDIFKTSCDLAVTYYPFDVQSCNLIVYLWLSSDQLIKLSAATKNISLNFFSENGLWDVASTSAKALSVNGFTEVVFTMNLKRRRLFYVMNIIIPIVFLSCLAPLVFALPAECGEKMGFSVTVLLAYTVFLTIIGGSMPQTSIQTAILSVYLTAMVIISAASVILSTVILRIHSQPEDSPPSQRLQKATHVMRRILCMNTARSYTSVTPTGNNNTAGEKRVKTSTPSTGAYVTWKMVAETMDTSFLILFTVLTIAITVPSLATMGAQKVS